MDWILLKSTASTLRHLAFCILLQIGLSVFVNNNIILPLYAIGPYVWLIVNANSRKLLLVIFLQLFVHWVQFSDIYPIWQTDVLILLHSQLFGSLTRRRNVMASIDHDCCIEVETQKFTSKPDDIDDIDILHMSPINERSEKMFQSYISRRETTLSVLFLSEDRQASFEVNIGIRFSYE